MDSDKEPEWKMRLRASQERMQAAFVASGITEEKMAHDVQAAVNDYRAERSLMEFDQAFGPLYAVATQRSGKSVTEVAAALKAPGQIVSHEDTGQR